MRVLIVRVGAMGDVLHALPAVASLRAAQPGWTIDWVIDPRWAPLLLDVDAEPPLPGPLVTRAHMAEVKLWKASPLSLATLHSLRRLRQGVRAEKYDLVVDMQGTLRSAVIARFARAPVAGYGEPRERAAAWLYTHKLRRNGAHIVDMNAALLSKATDLNLAPVAPELPLVEWAAKWAAEEAAAGRLCVLAPGAGWGAKRWLPTNYGELAQKLHERGFDVVVNAPRKDNPLAAEVVGASRGTARTVVCNVTGLIALTRRAALLVGGDSGPTHLAAALGVPLVALFGPTDPARNGPWGSGTSRMLRNPLSVTSYKRLAAPDPGLERISVEEVLAAALEVERAPHAAANSSHEAP